VLVERAQRMLLQAFIDHVIRGHLRVAQLVTIEPTLNASQVPTRSLYRLSMTNEGSCRAQGPLRRPIWQREPDRRQPLLRRLHRACHLCCLPMGVAWWHDLCLLQNKISWSVQIVCDANWSGPEA